MKKLSLIFVLALAVVAGVAQTPFTATYTFGTSGNTTPFVYNGTQYSGITMGDLEKSTQLTCVDSPGNFRATDWPTGGATSVPFDPCKYIGFTINAKTGYKFTINSITFGIGRAANGTRYAQWRGSEGDYAAAINNYTSTSGLTNNAGVIEYPGNTTGSWTGLVLSLNGVSGYQNVTTCGFRVYFYNAMSASAEAGLQGPITITGTYTPSVHVSTTSLTGFEYQQGTGPSEAQTVTVTGVGLQPNHSALVTAGGAYEVCLTEEGTYTTLLNVPPNDATSGNVGPRAVYIRLRKGLYADNYSGDVAVGYYADIPGTNPVQQYNIEKIVSCSGTVTQAPEYYIAFEKLYETKTYTGSGNVYLGVNELYGNLNTGFQWNMTDALIGTEPANVINGTRSARLLGYSTSAMTMLEDKPNGAGMVTFKYRSFIENSVIDSQVTWKVEYSINEGDNWTQVGQPFTAPADNKIYTFTGYVNKSCPVRIRIVRANTSQNPSNNLMRTNIDCIRVLHYYDFPRGVEKTVGESPNTYLVTVTGGNANYSIINTIPGPVPNPDFTATYHRCLTLLGAGSWDFYIEGPIDHWAGYKQAGVWHVQQMTDGTASFTVTPSRNREIELLMGSGEDPTLPVTLSHFSATMTAENYVQLTWISQTETNLLGYHVYRNSSDNLSSAMRISELIEGTNTSQAQTYIYLDQDLYQDGTYYYWLQNVDMDGASAFHGPASVVFTIGGNGGAPAIPKFTRLENAYPNPFNPNTTISYQLKDPGRVKIDIYNTRGQILRSFEHSHAEAGHYGFLWDGRDGSGKELPSGVYLLKMTSGSYSGFKKVVLQK